MGGKCITILLSGLVFLVHFSTAHASETPPVGSKPLSVIVKAVEEQRLGSLSEAEFENGLWEVKVCDAGVCQKLYIDPRTGEEKRRTKTDFEKIPPVNALPLSTIVQSIEASAQGIITEIEFEGGRWEAELRRGSREIKLAIDPMTGRTRP